MDTQILNLLTSTSTVVDNPTGTIQGIIDSAMAGEWLWMVGGIVMLIVWALRSFVLKAMKGDHAIIVSVVIAVLGAMGAVFSGAPADASVLSTVLKALGAGLTAGLAGGGFWSLIGKKILPTPKGRRMNVKKPEPPSDESDSDSDEEKSEG